MSDETETIFVTLVATTPEALLVDIGLKDRNFWVPKSMAEVEGNLEDLSRGEEFDLTLPVWLCEKEGMI